MKALLIDPISRTITRTTLDNWRQISPALGCDHFDIVPIDRRNDLYLDDEGRLTYPNARGYFRIGDFLVCGRGLVLGQSNGDSVDTTIDPEALRDHIEWCDTPAPQEVEPAIMVSSWDE
jgi:hypothetical protein